MENVQLDKLRAEEAEMEAMAFGNHEPVVEPVVEPTIEPIVEIEVQPEFESETSPKQQRTNWKKRFTTYKASTDTTIYELRRELSDLRAELASTMDLMSQREKEQPKVDIFSDTFSQEDVDTFGTDGLEVVKKAARAIVDGEVEPLKEKLAKAEQARIDALKRQSEDERKRDYAQFLSNLESIVPDYASINIDPKFLEWMKLPDTYSGLNRAELFKRAEASGDVQRVADFFVEYVSSTTPPVPNIEEYITPVGSGVEVASTSKQEEAEVIYTSEINKFYDDVMKGRYEGRHDEVLMIEQKIEDAHIKGLIRQG